MDHFTSRILYLKELIYLSVVSQGGRTGIWPQEVNEGILDALAVVLLHAGYICTFGVISDGTPQEKEKKELRHSQTIDS